VLLVDKHPDSNVELALPDQQRPLDVLLQHDQVRLEILRFLFLLGVNGCFVTDFDVLLEDALEVFDLVENLHTSASVAVVGLQDPHVGACKVRRSDRKRRLAFVLKSLQLLINHADLRLPMPLDQVETVLELLRCVIHLVPAGKVNHEGQRLVVEHVLVVQLAHLLQISEQLVLLRETLVELKVVGRCLLPVLVQEVKLDVA
jgi:hypothetical protein